MDKEEECLPLGAQQQSEDNEEQQHFHQVCQSYQQYATFHQTRQRGVVNHRLHQLLLANVNNVNVDKVEDVEGEGHPTIESILPPNLLPSSTSTQHQQIHSEQYQKQFNEATIRNQYFLDTILQYSGVATSQEVLKQRRQSGDNTTKIEWSTEESISKIDSVLKSVVRDWSTDGNEERSVVYDRLVNALITYMPPLQQKQQQHGDDESIICNTSRRRKKVAVPGSGLGRLAWEIYSRGYSTQGSDFSLPMLLASDFILNGCGLPPSNDDERESSVETTPSYRQFAICPWIGETKNVMSFQHRVRSVVVPDVDPTSIQFDNNDNNNEGEDCNDVEVMEENNEDAMIEAPEFTMMAGEFLSLYSHFLPENQQPNHAHDVNGCINNHHHHHQNSKSTEKFDAVVCSFFLDTAPSIPHYLLTIYHMLQDDGLLLHFGPLMYHWSGHGGLIPNDLEGSVGSNSNGKGSAGNKYQQRTKHLDSRYKTSIDYTWEEIRYMIVKCGFEIVEEEMYIPAKYTSDKYSMMKVVYDCVFLVARKKKR